MSFNAFQSFQSLCTLIAATISTALLLIVIAAGSGNAIASMTRNASVTPHRAEATWTPPTYTRRDNCHVTEYAASAFCLAGWGEGTLGGGQAKHHGSRLGRNNYETRCFVSRLRVAFTSHSLQVRSLLHSLQVPPPQVHSLRALSFKLADCSGQV